ncbi:hypothetical protein QBC40DRAFT_249426 [Triangularia verruculosa]|uniref:Uncharacterized protein n=1 Tax=Triangularia verruculosa TaxID=2587418 RepID=A0AAN6XUX7_9PEZI|nr:hypothetical protein QBC40DRAFT_249426 [Triangularia verruculosa]
MSQGSQPDPLPGAQSEPPFIPPPFVPIATSTNDLIQLFGPFSVNNPVAEQLLNESAEEGSQDFPTDFEGQSALVQQMYYHIFEVDDIVDNKEVQQGLRGGRIGGARNRVKTMSPRYVQLICWELLFEARNAQAGNFLLPVREYQDPLLRKSKAMVVQLMTPSPIQRAVAAPEAELKQKQANNKGSKGKGRERAELKRVRRAQSAPANRPRGNLAVPQNQMAVAQNPVSQNPVAESLVAVPTLDSHEANDVDCLHPRTALAQASQVNNLQASQVNNLQAS